MSKDNRQELLGIAMEMEVSHQAMLLKANINTSKQAQIAGCLCLTIAELCGAVLLILESPYQNQVTGLIRSMHEALIDLKNLVKSPRYLDQMEFDNAKQALKVLKGFQADPEFQQDEAAMKMIGEWIARHEPTFEELKAKGLKPQTIQEAFVNVGRGTDYVGYCFLCSGTHNNINELIARHAADGHLRVTDDLPYETFKSYTTMAVGIFTQALIEFHIFTDIPKKDLDLALEKAERQWEEMTNQNLKGENLPHQQSGTTSNNYY